MKENLLPKFLDNLLEKVIKRPKTIILLVVLVASVLGLPGVKVRMDNDPRKLVFAGSDEIKFMEAHQNLFEPDDTTLFLLFESSLEDRQKLVNFVENISETIASYPEFTEVYSITRTAILKSQGEDLVISPAFGKKSLLKGSYEEKLKNAFSSSLVGGTLSSKDGTLLLVAARMDKKYKIVDFLPTPTKKVKELVQKESQNAGFKIDHYYGGIPFVRLESILSIQEDMIVFFPLTFLLITIFLFLLFKRFYAVIFPMLALSLAIGVSSGFLGIMDEKLNPLSSIFPILILVITIADAIHFINRFRELRSEGLTKDQALRASFKHMVFALFLTSFTSAVGFFSLNLTQMPVLHSFGNVVAIGILAAFVILVLILPAGMVLSKGDDNKINESKQSGPLEFNLSPLVSYLIKPPIAILITIIGASVLSYSLYESKNLKVDYFNNKVLDDKHPINYGNIAIDQKMAGSLLVDLQVWGDEEAFKEIDNLQKIQIISDLSQKIFESKRVLNVAALLRDLKNSISGESSLPNSDEELSQLLMLLEGDENSGLFRLISPEFDKARISIYIRDLGANKILVCQNELIKKAEEILKGSGLKIKVTGMVSISASGFSTLAFELIYSLISALLVIILTIGIVFRSLRLAIASILPNLLPLMLPLLYYSISGNYLDLFASVCFVIAVGIAVDDTIHLLARFQEEYKKDKDFDRAIKISVNHSISAIISTSLILCFGFAILLFSQFPANRLFSKLSCVIIFLALFADLIFTPAVLSLLYPKKKA